MIEVLIGAALALAALNLAGLGLHQRREDRMQAEREVREVERHDSLTRKVDSYQRTALAAIGQRVNLEALVAEHERRIAALERAAKEQAA